MKNTEIGNKTADINVRKQQFINTVNCDGSKQQKSKRAILLSITLTFKQCDGG